MPKQMLMMEPGDHFVTMDRRNRPGTVKMWQVLEDGRITPVSPVTREPEKGRGDGPTTS